MKLKLTIYKSVQPRARQSNSSKLKKLKHFIFFCLKLQLQESKITELMLKFEIKSVNIFNVKHVFTSIRNYFGESNIKIKLLPNGST